MLYPILEKFRVDVTVIDMELGELLKLGDLFPLLLNIAYDGIVLYDKRGQVTRVFESIKKAIKNGGMKRYRTPDGKYGWKLKHPLQEVKIPL